jgi:hypothetical protein
LGLPTLHRAILVQPRHYDRVLAIKGIGDERAYYFSSSGLRSRPLAEQVGHDMRYIRDLRAQDPARLRLVSVAGRSGFMSGPLVYVIDSFALTNPLMARIAIRKDREWRIGHFERRVPEGYLSTLLDAGPTIANPAIRDLYTRIEVVARGRLFAPGRWSSILSLNNPLAQKVYPLDQPEIVEPAECVALTHTKLESLDLQLLWGAAKTEILAGHQESAKRILTRLFWMLREKRRSLLSPRDFVVEIVEMSTQLSKLRFDDATDLLAFVVAEMPNRKEPLLALADLYTQVDRGQEAAALRDRASKLPVP